MESKNFKSKHGKINEDKVEKVESIKFSEK
jgi:hypothetical protein